MYEIPVGMMPTLIAGAHLRLENSGAAPVLIGDASVSVTNPASAVVLSPGDVATFPADSSPLYAVCGAEAGSLTLMAQP
jgi:hypothetical protein